MRFTYLSNPAGVVDWAKRLINDLNSNLDQAATYPGPYANDAAAASAGIPVGSSYMDTSGIYRRRLT